MPHPVQTSSDRRSATPWRAAVPDEPTGPVQQRRSDPASSRDERRGPRELADELLGLSAVVTQLRRICARVPEDLYLQRRLTAVIGQLEAVGAELLTARERPPANAGDSGPTEVAPVPDSRSVDIRGAEAEAAFLDWLNIDTDQEGGPRTSSGGSVPDRRGLGELSGSTRRLPPRTARALALPTDATIGDAAVQILLAVHDPSGPRCASYAEAIRFISDNPEVLTQR